MNGWEGRGGVVWCEPVGDGGQGGGKLTRKEILAIHVCDLLLVLFLAGLQDDVDLAQRGEAVEEAAQLVGTYLPPRVLWVLVAAAEKGAEARAVAVSCAPHEGDPLEGPDMRLQRVGIEAERVDGLQVRVEEAAVVDEAGAGELEADEVCFLVDAVHQLLERQLRLVPLRRVTDSHGCLVVDRVEHLEQSVAGLVLAFADGEKVDPELRLAIRALASDKVNIWLADGLRKYFGPDFRGKKAEARETRRLVSHLIVVVSVAVALLLSRLWRCCGRCCCCGRSGCSGSLFGKKSFFFVLLAGHATTRVVEGLKQLQ